MSKATKKGKKFFIVGKLILLIGFAVYLFEQIKKMDWSWNIFDHFNPLWFVLSFLLVVPNWWCEWMKWRLTLKVANIRSSPFEIRNSFFAGIITGMLTPNMIGNFVGRLMYFSKSSSISVTVLTLLSNYAQFVISMLVGFISLLYLRMSPLGVPPNHLILLGGLVLLVLFVGYFYFDSFFKFIFPKRMKLFYHLKDFRYRLSFRWQILGISMLRLMIFTIQMLLMLAAFGTTIDLEFFFWIWQYYFWVTLTPSLFLGKVIIRDSVAVWVLTSIHLSGPIILISSFSIWLINLVLPTVLALVLIRKK